MRDARDRLEPAAKPTALQAYVLGSMSFESTLAFQRQLVFQVSGETNLAAVVLCEHPPLVTIGRQGSRAHVLLDDDQLRSHEWPIRWVNRGGGCILHVPGQLAVYPIFNLRSLGMDVATYLDRFRSVLTGAISDCGAPACGDARVPGVRVGPRLIAVMGAAVQDWVSYHGAVVNANPELGPFHWIQSGGAQEGPMTSLERELRVPFRPAQLRERILDRMAAEFGFDRTSLFFDHPSLAGKAKADALASSARK